MITSTEQARVKLEEIVQRNISATAQVIGRVMDEVPDDHIVKSNVIGFNVVDSGSDSARVEMQVPGVDAMVLHNHALRQVSERAHVPAVYVDHLLTGASWQQEMLGDVMTRSFAHMGGRNLVRSVGGQVRAILSDKFRRLDSRPIVDTFIGEVNNAGAVPYSAHANDVRVSIKAIVPTIRALRINSTNQRVPWTSQNAEEYVAFGIELSNSDYGAGTLSIRSFFLRLVCLNGATAEDVMREVHLGRRLGDDLEFSRQTYELDTRTTVSAVKDIVSKQLGPHRIDELVQRITQASEKPVEWAHLKGQLSKALSKEELQKATDSFVGPDVVNLPPGNTVWRASNAISWLAQSIDNGDRKLELEKLAGGILTGKVSLPAAA